MTRMIHTIAAALQAPVAAQEATGLRMKKVITTTYVSRTTSTTTFTKITVPTVYTSTTRTKK